MDRSDTKNAALILIDIQKGFDDIIYWGGERNNPMAENNASLLLERWRKLSLPLFHIQYCSSNPKSILHELSPGNAHKDEVKPLEYEKVITKNVNSSFIGTDLKDQLNAKQIDTLIVCGLTTDHCVSTTVRMAGNYGFKTFLVHDACATFCKIGINGEIYNAETMHLVALAQLKDEFATILSTQDVLNSFFI